MKIAEGKYAGEALKTNAPVKKWRQSPGNLTAACVAARYYADKDGKRKVVVAGNSYGHRVMNITDDDVDLKKFTVVACEAQVMVVYPGGKVFQGVAS